MHTARSESIFLSTWDQASGKLITAAQYYGSIGWKVLPCYGIVNGRCTCNGTHPEPKDVGKHPQIAQWNEQASSEIAQIDTWWSAAPESNVGVFCRESGFG